MQEKETKEKAKEYRQEDVRMKDKKTGIAIFLIAVLFFTANIAWSHDSHQNTSVTNVYNSQGVALGIAMAQINPSINTSKRQAGFGLGSFGNSSAFAVGIAKRITPKILLGAKIGFEDGKTGVGLGLNMKF